MRVSLSVFVSIFADNKFKDLNESKLSNMIEKIKLQLICWNPQNRNVWETTS